MKYEMIVWEDAGDLGVKRYDIVETHSNRLQYIGKYTGKTVEDALNIFRKHPKTNINFIDDDAKSSILSGYIIGSAETIEILEQNFPEFFI